MKASIHKNTGDYGQLEQMKQQVMVISGWLAQTRDLGLQTITKLRFCTVCVCAHT